MIVLWGIVQPYAKTEAEEQSDATEKLLHELKKLYQQDLISKDVYQKKLKELLDTGPNLSGVWQLTVKDLSIWAPPYTLVKATGRIHWKLSVVDGNLSLLAHDSSSEVSDVKSSSKSLPDDLFEKIEIREVIARDDLIAFKIEGIAGAYEAYWLEDFSEDRIVGTYTVYDRYGGGPGSGPEYRARLILQKIE